MPTSSLRSSRLFSLLVVAALVMLVRLPFLLRADRFFDSDEAVEGLMARHLLHGEFPAFLWGQHYKGVPEVYLAAALFSVTGSGVIALKSVTLGCFVLFAGLQFLLVRQLFSARIAWLATAFVAIGPPSLVHWSLSANAEIVMTLLAGAVMGLALLQWRRTRSPFAMGAAAAALGFGLWVQQYILYYVIALGISVLLTHPDRAARVRDLVVAKASPMWLRVLAWTTLGIASAYIVLGAIAFVTGGFDVILLATTIGLRSPQKLWRLGAAMLAASSIAIAFGRIADRSGRAMRRPFAAAFAGFVLGYAPVLAASFQPGRTAPVPRMDLRDLRVAFSPIAHGVLPVLTGFRGPTTEWMGVSAWFALLLAAVIVVSYLAIWLRGANPFFHVLLIVVPVVFIASGSFVDAQSYRYVMPVYAALPTVVAVGVDAIWRRGIVAGVAVLTLLLAVWGVEQRAWYDKLTPDTKSPAAIRCFRSARITGATADYWTSYKLTFLTDEQIVVAPETGFDRYPAYTSFVESLRLPRDQPCRSLLLQ